MLRLVLPRMPLRVPQEPSPPTAAVVPALALAPGAPALLMPAPPELAGAVPAAPLVVPASGRELVPADVVLPLTAAGELALLAGALAPPVGAGLVTFAEVPALAAGPPGLTPFGAAGLEPQAAVVTTNKLGIKNSDVDRIGFIVHTARG